MAIPRLSEKRRLLEIFLISCYIYDSVTSGILDYPWLSCQCNDIEGACYIILMKVYLLLKGGIASWKLPEASVHQLHSILFLVHCLIL